MKVDILLSKEKKVIQSNFCRWIQAFGNVVILLDSQKGLCMQLEYEKNCCSRVMQRYIFVDN